MIIIKKSFISRQWQTGGTGGSGKPFRRKPAEDCPWKMAGNQAGCPDSGRATRGVDVNAKFEIYSVINELAKAGIAVIMVSSELPEIINMCDNVCVIKAGKMTGMLGREELDQERIMQYAAGGEE